MKIILEEFLSSEEKERIINFNEKIKELGDDVVAKGLLSVIKQDYGINVKGEIETIVTLECNRCLKNFSFHVNIYIDEKFINGILVEDNVKDFEIKNDNFVEDLSDRTEIDLTDLVYQSIILNIPNEKLCSEACQGSEYYQQFIKEENIDPRMEIFKNIKINNE